MTRSALVVALSLLSAPAVTHAQLGLRVNELAQGAVRVDGMLRDWQGLPFAEVGAAQDSSMRYALGYDVSGLFVAAEVRDERFVRTSAMGANEDSIVVTLAMPDRTGFRRIDIWLFAGEIGRTAGAAFVGSRPNGRRVDQARVVEGPRTRGSGYVLEAFLPWAVLGTGDDWQRGRGAVRLRDVDSEARPTVAERSSAPIDPIGSLPLLMPTGGPAALLSAFRRERGLEATEPRFDLSGDVANDGRPERVTVVDRFVVVTGPGFRDGRALSFLELTVSRGSDIRSAELTDLTADGKREVIVVFRQGSIDTWQALRVMTNGDIVRALTLEAVVTVSAGRRSEPPTIVATGGPRFVERVHRWDGTQFAITHETPLPPQVPVVASRIEPRPTKTSTVTATATAPRAPTIEELLNLFRRTQGLSSTTRPRWHHHANVAAGEPPEEVYVFGTTLLVLGPGFFGGTEYLHQQLPATDSDNVLDVRCEDATGDNRAEILVVVRQELGDVTRDVLHIYRFTPQGLGRILAVELARRQGRRQILNTWQVEGEGSGRHVFVRAGRARGWNAANWTFTEGTGDGVSPLLLPWEDPRRGYRLHGEAMARDEP